MPINASGQISLGGTTTGQSIEIELFKTGTEQLSLNDEKVRRLSGQSTGAVDFNTIRGKRYPWALQAVINPGSGYWGQSVAISADGKTVAMGNYADQTGGTNGISVGSVAIYVKNASDIWTQQAIIRPTGWTEYTISSPPYLFHYGPEIGKGIALSDDGNYLAIGGPQDNSAGTNRGIGRVWIWTRSGTTWSQQTTFRPTDYINGSSPGGSCKFGFSLKFSSDATTLAIGGPLDNTNNGVAIGAVWIYTRSGVTWTQQTKIVGSGYVAGYSGCEFGSDLSLSGDGNTLSFGGRVENGPANGAVYVWFRTGTSWAQQARFAHSAVGITTTGSYFGESVYLTPNGNTLIAGAPYAFSSNGCGIIMTRTGSTWSYNAQLKSTVPTAQYQTQGSSVAIGVNPYDSAQYDAFLTVPTAPYGMAVFTGSAASWTELPFISIDTTKYPTSSFYYGGDPSTGTKSIAVCPANTRIIVLGTQYGPNTFIYDK